MSGSWFFHDIDTDGNAPISSVKWNHLHSLQSGYTPGFCWGVIAVVKQCGALPHMGDTLMQGKWLHSNARCSADQDRQQSSV